MTSACTEVFLVFERCGFDLSDGVESEEWERLAWGGWVREDVWVAGLFQEGGKREYQQEEKERDEVITYGPVV